VKVLRKSTDYTVVIKSALFLFFCIVFNHLEKTIMPYSTAIFITALFLGENIISCAIFYLLSFVISGSFGLLGSAGIALAVMIPATIIHRKLKLKQTLAFSFYSILAVLGFVILGNTQSQVPLYNRILVSLFISILTLITVTAGRAIVQKGLKFKLGYEEFATVSLTIALFGLGISNFFSPIVWKGLSILIILYACYLFKLGTASIISTVLGVSLAVYYANVNYASTFLVLALSAESLMRFSRYVSVPAVMIADYLCYTLFKVYGAYGLQEFLPVLIAGVMFIITPSVALKKLKEKLYSFRERQLVRQTINRNRTLLSNKLYELSGVFLEMASAFNLFQELSMTDQTAKSAIEKQVFQTVCRECENYSRCHQNQSGIINDISKMTDIGFAKGKLTLIDMPRVLSSTCVKPNNILYALNKLLADFRRYKLDNENVKNGRELVALEASGVAEVLRSLALETSQTLKYQSRLERNLSNSLFKAGFTVTEILIYGEGERVSVGMIVAMQEFSHLQIQTVVSSTLGINMLLTEKANITEDKCYLSFSKCADYDAIFGIAKATKDGSEMSGDTHSVMRISGDRFLVALSDGMGSGKNAESISSTSLSLIECFYKAGLNSDLILNTVNTLLAINTEDSFTALDVSVIDLKTCTADFIKYGSPYGFIINDNGIKIVEGSSLPIGIIEQLKPSVCTSPLNDGDVILLLSDGVSDAFGCSSDIIDFLRTLPAKNPQTLANQVLEHAISLNDGQKKDDMTALAVRVFKV
jgi:stage II sporulation protein E